MLPPGFEINPLHSSVNRTASATKVLSLQVGIIALLASLGSTGLLSPLQALAVDAQTPATVAQIPVAATVVYVNPVLGNDAPGAGSSEATPYRTIAYALQQAKPGTVVQLARGSYTKESGESFPLAVPSGVTLRGNEADKGQTVAIIGGGLYASRTFARQSTTIVASDNSEIRGVTITNPNVRGTGIWVESTSPRVENCTFSNSNREGVFITGTGNPTVVRNNFITNQGNGISTANNAKGEIRDNLFQNTGFGLAIGGNSAPQVSGNRIIENTDGIYINDNARPVLRSNVIENNKRDGIVATIAAKPDLGTSESPGNNTIRNNAQNDLNNSTNGTLYSVGNAIDTRRIAGRVEFTAPIASGAFSDTQGHWAQAYIEALAKRNIISGFPEGTFRPNDPVTRVQFAAIINKAFAPSARQATAQFSDVSSSFWGYQPIQVAVRGGFMKGYPEGVFRPDQQIPRVQVLVALASGLGFSSNDLNVLSRYQDATQIPSWASNAVAAATQRQVVVNYPTLTQLNPNREATRAEVAAFVYQSLVNAGKADAIPSQYVVSLDSGR